ncbi:response regulator transcription factor [bacterium]|nr:MAG: response regulator transcription factor [bacterium]
MIKVLIADDHAVVRQGLKQILSEQPDMNVLGEAGSIPELLDHVRKQKWDIVVLDISMPGRGGLDGLKELKQEQPKLPVLILSIHPEDQFAVRALKAGASGYLTKDSAPEELVQAIRKLLAGRKYIGPELAEKLATDLEANSAKARHETLSDREFQILRLIASGKSVTEIAQKLSLSVKTVSTYRARILEKMNMRTNAELMHYAIKHNLAD